MRTIGRCGCGDNCACRIESGQGVTVTGVGSANNPYRLRFDGSVVADQGLRWDAASGQLSTKLAPNGGLVFDAQGAMMTTAESGGGGGIPDLVASLERRTSDVIGGAFGAGYLIKPENHRRSYDYGLSAGLDYMHVSVRFLSDGTPVVYTDENLGRTTYFPYESDHSYWHEQRVEDQDPHRWQILPSPSGMDNPLAAHQPPQGADPLDPVTWDPARWHRNAPIFGWFGYLEQPQYGLSFLADILNQCGGRIPLLLQLVFPTRNEGGDFPDTPTWRIHLFLRQVRYLLQLFRLQKSVIVATTSSDFTVPAMGGSETPMDTLAFFSDAGCRVGPLLTAADVDRYLPSGANWPANWTWAFLHTSVPVDTMTQFPAAGIHSCAYLVNRHYQRTEIVEKAGLKGVLAGDPIYYSGALPGSAHQLAGARYRHPSSTFGYSTVDYGLLPPQDGSPAMAQCTWRGTRHVNNLGTFYGSQLARDPRGAPCRTYWVGHHWCAPNPDPTNYSIDYEWSFADMEPTGGVAEWMAISFGIATDHAFADFTADDAVTPPRPGHELDSGYVLIGSMSNNYYLDVFDRGTFETEQVIGGQNFAQGVPQRLRIIVCAHGIRVCTRDASGAVTGVLLTMTDEPHVRYRGGYINVGRYSFDTLGWTGWMGPMTVRWGAGESDWADTNPPSRFE